MSDLTNLEGTPSSTRKSSSSTDESTPAAKRVKTNGAAQPAAQTELAILQQDVALSHSVLDYGHFLSEESAARLPPTLQALAVQTLGKKGQISFAGGLPHPSTFPISQVAFSFPRTGKTVVHSSIAQATPADLEVVQGEEQDLSLPLDNAQQYQGPAGNPKLMAFLREHVQRAFNPPYADWDVVQTAGNTDAIDNIVRMLLQKGDSVLVEEFCYPGTLEAMLPIGIKPVAIQLDKEGMCPSHLDNVLSSWSTEQGPKPKLVIVVPTGQNPSGTNMGHQRRLDIYAVARKHHLLIFSDDPYRHVVVSLEEGVPAESHPSFLSLDHDGRVIDASTFSKVVFPGSRLGWITAPKALIERLCLRNGACWYFTSGLSVSAVTSFLGTIGGQEGWEKYLAGISDKYSLRARRMHQLFQEHLPLDVCDWNPPRSGMFIFLRTRTGTHPRVEELGPDGVQMDIFDKAVEEGVTMAPSAYFKADPSVPSTNDNIFFRCSFSYPNDAEMEEGAKRLGRAIRRSYGI